MRRAILFGFFLVTSVNVVKPADITTSSGKVLKNAEIIAVASDDVMIKHDGGSERVAWADLPAALQEKLKSAPGFAELRHKELEIEKLRQQLGRSEAELTRLQQQLAVVANRPTPVAITNAPRVVARQESKALADEEVVAARDLALDFQVDPAAADARYGKKVFRVKGEILRFDPQSFQRRYDVLLDTGDKAILAVCHFTYPQKFNAVYTKDRGTRLVGVPSGKGEVSLLEVGQTITIKGTCAGLKDSEIAFTGCEVVR